MLGHAVNSCMTVIGRWGAINNTNALTGIVIGSSDFLLSLFLLKRTFDEVLLDLVNPVKQTN
ncbi:MAG: hypothetical protein J6O61_07905 [Butyrivibrio sp.]|nr:hypothetical protein [Butyrivibrio sp.]